MCMPCIACLVTWKSRTVLGADTCCSRSFRSVLCPFPKRQFPWQSHRWHTRSSWPPRDNGLPGLCLPIRSTPSHFICHPSPSCREHTPLLNQCYIIGRSLCCRSQAQGSFQLAVVRLYWPSTRTLTSLMATLPLQHPSYHSLQNVWSFSVPRLSVSSSALAVCIYALLLSSFRPGPTTRACRLILSPRGSHMSIYTGPCPSTLSSNNVYSIGDW